jgi:hypothetical protein
MAAGPGKYDDLCTLVRERAAAAGALLIIVNGEKGSGFSCQADLMTTAGIPDLLEDIARQIRADMAKGRL